MAPRKFRLFGSYRTPKVRMGQKVECEVRGTLKVVRLSDSRIPWPWGSGPTGRATLVLYGDLARPQYVIEAMRARRTQAPRLTAASRRRPVGSVGG